VRQLVLQKGDVPVKRNFYEKEDVPDMEHLLDKKKLMQTLDIRHKIELMERSSKINQDKTDILLYNNPVPDLVNASGEEGIDRYLSDRLEDVCKYLLFAFIFSQNVNFHVNYSLIYSLLNLLC